MSESAAAGFIQNQIIADIGSGAFLGFLTGYAAKKVVKIVAIIVGLQLALFKFLEAKGVMTVDWSQLSTAAANNTTSVVKGTTTSMSDSFLSMLPMSGGFAAGAALGFKKA